MFLEVSLPTNLALFFIAAGGVWLAGARLTYLVDRLADRLRLARSLMGLLVLSLATSLPEGRVGGTLSLCPTTPAAAMASICGVLAA